MVMSNALRGFAIEVDWFGEGLPANAEPMQKMALAIAVHERDRRGSGSILHGDAARVHARVAQHFEQKMPMLIVAHYTRQPDGNSDSRESDRGVGAVAADV